MQRFTTRLLACAASLAFAAYALQTAAAAEPENGSQALPQILDDKDLPATADGKQDKRPVSPQTQGEKDTPVAASGKEDQLPVPPATRPEREHPRSTESKADREPIPPRSIRRKQLTKEMDRLAPETEDRLVPDAPDPDRLVPDTP